MHWIGSSLQSDENVDERWIFTMYCFPISDCFISSLAPILSHC